MKTLKTMLEDKLQEIIVVEADTKEVLAIISKDNEIVQKDNVDVILNYTPNKKILKDIDGKIYLNEDKEV